ncbi:hypothetical protein P7K49_023346 [Saguinus oedipus]|uniref:Uncharacterized protein n=1 Tax=Saguinus oedipus TaxID=9490 RepID=A0ABQ9ULD1_SAGOE|nr:hypothetical protein P7K49_023346 [Saguinus oedipus]
MGYDGSTQRGQRQLPSTLLAWCEPGGGACANMKPHFRPPQQQGCAEATAGRDPRLGPKGREWWLQRSHLSIFHMPPGLATTPAVIGLEMPGRLGLHPGKCSSWSAQGQVVLGELVSRFPWLKAGLDQILRATSEQLHTHTP